MRGFARLALLSLATVPLDGCYLMQAAHGQWEVMSKRRAIAQVIADPVVAPAVKDQLRVVQQVRSFAVNELGLPDNDSYRSYADIGRPYVVWNVFAAPEFSVEPRRWCFPIAGCVSYRGYFDRTRAQAFAAKLARRKFDVAVAGVPAYSTLGHFADPVLNTMMGWSEVQLAAIVFHELAHQVLYLPGDSRFNEAFATVVEEEGVKRWLSHVGRDRELAAYRRYKQHYSEFSQLLVATRERLRALYASAAPEKAMREGKRSIFAELKQQYEARRAQWNGAFDGWFARELNNAQLVAIATYQDCVPGFETVLSPQSAGDLRQFYARARELARLEAAARNRKLCHRPAAP